MKLLYLIISIQINLLFSTFSIVAVDTVNNEVGSAGASCIGNSVIISDLHPNLGAINTQSYYLSSNQDYASELLNLGLSPNEIIELLIQNDIANNPSIRQYGIVDLVNGGRSAAFTGNNCLNYKGHITGANYAIQGNILLGEHILTQMENNFINNSGTLADKLMAAMQGANQVGADTRCLEDSTSSLSSFIQIAKPNDDINNIYLDIRVGNTFGQTEPIDSLQTLYDNWIINNTTFDLGDINQDQMIDVLDIILLVNYILGINDFSLLEYYLADCNNDNIINIQDVIILVSYIINI